MLILTRKKGERIVILLPDGRQVAVGVHELSPGRVKLAFSAPPGLKIYRQEVQHRRDRTNSEGTP